MVASCSLLLGWVTLKYTHKHRQKERARERERDREGMRRELEID